MPATSLAEWLRSIPDDALATLLRLRRDLATPPPPDAGVLATRAGTAGSMARACDELDTVTLAVAETLLVAGADIEPVPASRVERLLGVDPVPALAKLRERALAWGDDDAVSIPPAATEVFGPFPAGLGAQAPALDGLPLAEVLAELGQDERALLHTLDAGHPTGATRDAGADVPLERAETPVQRLLARGLLLRRDNQTVELPRQLGIALRGGRVLRAETLRCPAPATRAHQQQTVDETAAGEALEFLRQVEALLRSWSAQPAPVLKSGGLGVREQRKLARELEVDDELVALLVEVVVGAGLVAESQSNAPEWVPTTLADSWLASTPAGRWLPLARAWLALPRLPGLAGHRDTKDRPLVPLAAELRRPLAPAARRRTLDALAELPSGTGFTDPGELAELLAWRAPRRGGRLRDELVRWTMSEGAALGVLALGGLTTATAALLGGDHNTAMEAMAEAMPRPVDQVLVQADLTVVAPGPLEPELATEVAAVADVESAGHATVYRVTESSVRRALDTGRTAGELHELFATRSTTPVPQGLTYLIDDVARRHGRLRAGAAASFLRCDDEVLLREVTGQLGADLELRLIAPTVLVSPVPIAELLDRLRAAGFAPAAEGPDGRVVDLGRDRGRRVPAPSRTAAGSPVTEPASPDAEQAAEIVAHVRAGDRAASTRRGETARLPGGGGADTSATLALLARATRERREVWIGFVDSHGTANQRVITPARVGGGVLEGANAERYPLHRITSAALVED